MYAIDVATQAVTSVNLGGPIYGTPCIFDGQVFVCVSRGAQSGRGELHALAEHTLAPEWTYVCPVPSEQAWSSPTVFQGAVYFGTRVAGLSPDPRLRTVDLASRTDRVGSPVTTQFPVEFVTPGIDAAFGLGPRVYVSDISCWVTAARCDTGEFLWEARYPDDNSPMYASPVITDGYIFVGSDYNSLYRVIDGGSGPSEFEPLSTGGRVRSTAAAWNSRVFFGCEDGYLRCVPTNPFPTSAVWQQNLGSAITGSPAISTSTELVFIAAEDGVVCALDADTGEIQAGQFDIRADLGSETAIVRSSPALAEGRLYIVAADPQSSGRVLYCLGDQ